MILQCDSFLKKLRGAEGRERGKNAKKKSRRERKKSLSSLSNGGNGRGQRRSNNILRAGSSSSSSSSIRRSRIRRSVRSSECRRSSSPGGVSGAARPPRGGLFAEPDGNLFACFCSEGSQHRGLDSSPGLGVPPSRVALEDDLAESSSGSGRRGKRPGDGSGDALAPGAGGPAADAAELDALELALLLPFFARTRKRPRHGGCRLLGSQPVKGQRPELSSEGRGPAQTEAAGGEHRPLSGERQGS